MIPFSPPFIDKKIISAVENALNSGWITTGPKTKAFETKIGIYCNVPKVLALNSWTAAAELLLRWYGITNGDEVIVPAYTYCATANIVIHCGAKPVLVDVTDNFLIDVDKIADAITDKTKAIISVDIAGLPVDYDKINEIIKLKQEIFTPATENQQKLGKILFLSDAAHSFGAQFKGVNIGPLADFTVFSFHAVKNLTTAEGGGICLNLPKPFENQEVYNELNIWSLHGQTKDALAKSQKGAWEYDVITAGYKCNMTDILAAIGIVELDRYESILEKRKEIFQFYVDAFKNLDWAILPEYKSDFKETSYHLFLLRIKGIGLEERNRMIQKIFELEVAVNVHYKPLPLLTFYNKLGYDIEDYPQSKELWENEISLPVYFGLSLEDAGKVVNAVKESYEIIING